MENLYPYTYLGILVSTLSWFYLKAHEKKTGIAVIGFWISLVLYLACIGAGEAGLLKKLVFVLPRDIGLFVVAVLIGNNLARKPKLFAISICCLAAFFSLFYFEMLQGSFGESGKPYRLVEMYRKVAGRIGNTVAIGGDHRFSVIALGTAGGITQDNLSSYLIAPKGKDSYVSLDAGTGLSAIKQAYENGCFKDIKIPKDSELLPEVWLLKNHVKSYLISHSHLDHLTGLVLNSTEDSSKTIMGFPEPINKLRAHIFNGIIWPNFGNEGPAPKINTYQYTRITAGREFPIPETELHVTPFPLSHAGLVSTAFLIRSGEYYAIYFGDTGPDKVEKGNHLRRIWEKIAPLAKKKKLRAVFLETSYPDPLPEERLFGHLTPTWLMGELRVLAELTDPEKPGKALAGLPVLITHVKPATKKGESAKNKIGKQLEKLNDLKVRFVFPEQGQRIEL